MMVVHQNDLQSNGGGGELDKVMWDHLTNSHVIEENRHQNNVNTERLHQQRNASTQFDGIIMNFLHLGSTNVGILDWDMGM